MVSEWPIEPLITRPNRTGKAEKLGSKSSSSRTAERSEDRVRGTLNLLKIRVRTDRSIYVKSQLAKNYQNLQQQLQEVDRLSRVRDSHLSGSAAGSGDNGGIYSGENRSLLIRSRLALFRENSRQPWGVGNNKTPQICSKLNAGNFDARKIVFVDNAKLESVSRLPSYTTWMFVDRNERMTKDQSIARRRRISYESNGKETFFCLDAEEAVEDGEEMKDIRGLSESEEFISRMVILEYGSGSGVLETIADFLQVSVAKVESRCQSTEGFAHGTNCSWSPATIHSVSQNFRRSIHNSVRYHHPLGNLQKEDEQGVHQVVSERSHAKVAPSNEEPETKMSSTLALALDSFNTLFCRRCLVFNCALHACFEEIVVGINERQPPCGMAQRDQPEPCSSRCRFFVSKLPRPPAATAPIVACSSGSDFRSFPSYISCATEIWQDDYPGAGRGIQEDHHLDGQVRTSTVDIQELDDDDREQVLLQCELRTITVKSPVTSNNAKKVPERFLNLEEAVPLERAVEDAESSSDSMAYKYERKHPGIPPHREDVFTSSRSTDGGNISTMDQKRSETSVRWCSTNVVDSVQIDVPPTKPANKWNRLEQDLCEKGIQIFGKNSCLIAQNVLKGCKSCQEIYEYIRKVDIAAAVVNAEEASSAKVSSERGNNLRSAELLHTGRVFRPKFRFGRKKVAPKSALGAIRKRIGRDGGVLNLCRQYTPCSCESRIGCGKDCPCVLVDMHCEKYCGCFKVCKNRFRGCQCAKSMCDRRHCPCFAAGRECDPDLCKFCWIECGHSSSQECHNMRILQRKKKRLVLSHSDVCTGWGVFTRHPLHKNDYIGEYTGELISHSEADRRGRIYDRETSFLFNLNDKLVVDAFRKGNKLKFANHSARKPNCYAKVLLVGGDHRVGIFAKDKIEAGEELLYDYQYEPEIAPLWATGPD